MGERVVAVARLSDGPAPSEADLIATASSVSRRTCNGVSRATAYRYVAEAVDVLSLQARTCRGPWRAMADGVPYVILDGKVFESDRCSKPMTSVKGQQVDAWYSGKAHRHGGNVQAVMRPGGLPLWTGPAEPGSVHDITAARWHALPALYRAAALGMPALADSGYAGAGIGVLTQ